MKAETPARAGFGRVASPTATTTERIDLEVTYEPALQSLECFKTNAKDVLKLYSLRRGILTSFDWGERNAVDADRLAKALKVEGEKVYHNTVIEFRRLWNLQGLEFTQGVFNEARFHRDES